MSTSVDAATSKRPRVIDSTSPEKRDEQVRNLPGDKCPHCNQVCTIESEAIQCDLCSNWVHAQCEGISSELYKSFSHVSSGIANMSYYCEKNNCSSWVKQLVFNYLNTGNEQIDTPSLRSLQTEQANLHCLILDVSAKLDNLCSRNNSLCDQINDASELINSVPTSAESPTTTALSIADELVDQERRKCNVIIYNLSESNNLSNDKAQFIEL